MDGGGWVGFFLSLRIGLSRSMKFKIHTEEVNTKNTDRQISLISVSRFKCDKCPKEVETEEKFKKHIKDKHRKMKVSVSKFEQTVGEYRAAKITKGRNIPMTTHPKPGITRANSSPGGDGAQTYSN